MMKKDIIAPAWYGNPARQPLACYYQVNIKNIQLRRTGSAEYATGRRNVEKPYKIIIMSHLSSSAESLVGQEEYDPSAYCIIYSHADSYLLLRKNVNCFPWVISSL
jgi:hypothetical protein